MTWEDHAAVVFEELLVFCQAPIALVTAHGLRHAGFLPIALAAASFDQDQITLTTDSCEKLLSDEQRHSTAAAIADAALVPKHLLVQVFKGLLQARLDEGHVLIASWDH